MQTEYCELCGAPISKGVKLVSIAGAKPMKVCEKCAKLGTEVQAPRAKQTSFGKQIPTQARVFAGQPSSNNAYRKRDVFDFIEGEVVDDYAKKIAAARQAKGFTQKDLAFILKMQEGDIKKLERGERAPTDAECKKLEKELDIVLIDKGDGEEKIQVGGAAATTLGDVLQVKKK
ncbi:MAG: multiprotein bridging factor aMBF1 [Methanocorpusculum sp.]|nr:multiprotein bridging factor aMBF1 [Methanocorpusculum sp.]